MKNSNAMAASVSQPTATAASHRAGRREAKATVSKMAERNQSMRDQIGREQIMEASFPGDRLLISAQVGHCEYRIRLLL
jgi:hypothetical protein